MKEVEDLKQANSIDNIQSSFLCKFHKSSAKHHRRVQKTKNYEEI
jgi:hypothetical protein